MLGRLAFLVGDNMALAVSADGVIMVRVDPAQAHTLSASRGVRSVKMPQDARAAHEGMGACDARGTAQHG